MRRHLLPETLWPIDRQMLVVIFCLSFCNTTNPRILKLRILYPWIWIHHSSVSYHVMLQESRVLDGYISEQNRADISVFRLHLFWLIFDLKKVHQEMQLNHQLTVCSLLVQDHRPHSCFSMHPFDVVMFPVHIVLLHETKLVSFVLLCFDLPLQDVDETLSNICFVLAECCHIIAMMMF